MPGFKKSKRRKARAHLRPSAASAAGGAAAAAEEEEEEDDTAARLADVRAQQGDRTRSKGVSTEVLLGASANSSPLVGQSDVNAIRSVDGQKKSDALKLTASQIKERLEKEVQNNVTIELHQSTTNNEAVEVHAKVRGFSIYVCLFHSII